MDVNSVVAPAVDTFPIVTFDRLASALLPFPDVWSRFSTPPKMALVASVRPANLDCSAFRTACDLGIAPRRREWRAADLALSLIPSRLSPSAESVTFLGTIDRRPRFNLRSRPVERFVAQFARPCFSVLFPIEGRERHPLIPSNDFWSARRGAILSVAKLTRYRRCASGAWMSFCFHVDNVLHHQRSLNADYAAMAKRRVIKDSPLFARVAAE
jgi:hypothetical protein